MKPNYRAVVGGNSLIQKLEISIGAETRFAIHYTKPSHLLKPFEHEACLRLLEEGNAVDMDYAAYELSKGIFTSILKLDNQIVGTGTIKRERPTYARTLSHKSKYLIDPTFREIGYVAVTENYRGNGIAQIVIEHLLFAYRPPGPLFATTSNPGMKTILERTRFTSQGVEWRGESDDLLSLWLRISN